MPGQYATIAIERHGKLVQRPYSIASSPLEPYLEFFIELVPDGELTPLLWELAANDKVFIRNRIVGKFTLDDSKVLRGIRDSESLNPRALSSRDPRKSKRTRTSSPLLETAANTVRPTPT